MTDAVETIILRSIDQQLLTIEDLAYYVQSPIEEVEATVQRLWDAGYIEPVKQRPVTALSLFSNPTQPSLDRGMVFNLTRKGHFHLHPVVKHPKERE